jgi:Ca2+-binding RTX toxin-like protein
MPLAAESITLPGSSLVFQNTYGSGVTDAYRSAIVSAENDLQSHFSNAVTVAINFDMQPMAPGFSAHNDYAVVGVSYAGFAAALAAHATTADDFTAVAGLPASDPSGGVGFWLPAPEARLLGLAAQGQGVDDTIILNSNQPFTFGPDAVGVLEHEITEGVFGRVASLGRQEAGWQPLDLFRFDAQGQRDFTGGADGVATYFGLDRAHVSALQYHNSISAGGTSDGFDLADWDHTVGDAFGPGGPGAAGTMSATDLQVLDILGWTPTAVAGSSQLTASGGSPAVSTIGTSGNDSLVATANATEIHAGAGNDTVIGAPLADYLRGDDGDDSVQGGAAFDDINGNKGDDTIDGGSGGGDWLVGGQGSDLITAHTSDNLLYGNLGNDTLIGGNGNDVARGGQGDDSIVGGTGNDFISGDRGNDTMSGGAGADIFHTFSGAGIDKVLDFHLSEGDRVQVDPGTVFTVSQVGADTVVDMGNGDEMILAGVQMSTLSSGWIFGG